MPLGELLEGRLVTRKGEFWVVLNHTRRGFPSYDVFLKMGFENDMAFPLTLAQVRSVPEGDRLPSFGDSTGAEADARSVFHKMLRGGAQRGGRRGRAGHGPENVDM